MSIRKNFVESFGEHQARAIEAAAKSHKNGIHDKKGSDPFKWAILVCIGYECAKKPHYRKEHEIKFSFAEFKKWCRTKAELGSHDGDCDYLALMSGAYSPFIKKKKELAK